MVKEGIDGEVMLRNTGVSRQWEGPPGCDIPMGGNAYMEMIASIQSSSRYFYGMAQYCCGSDDL
jgi:hypothetical protein